MLRVFLCECSFPSGFPSEASDIFSSPPLASCASAGWDAGIEQVTFLRSLNSIRELFPDCGHTETLQAKKFGWWKGKTWPLPSFVPHPSLVCTCVCVGGGVQTLAYLLLRTLLNTQRTSSRYVLNSSSQRGQSGASPSATAAVTAAASSQTTLALPPPPPPPLG